MPTGQVEEDLWGHVDIVQEKQHENELIMSRVVSTVSKSKVHD